MLNFINLLPSTPETVGIINQQLLEKLPDGAYLLNLARGVHVVEDDLLAALDSGKVKGAMLMFLIVNPYRRKSCLATSTRDDNTTCRRDYPSR